MGREEGQEDCAEGAVAWEVSAEAPCPLRPTPLFAGAEAPAGVLHPASRILNFNRFLFPQPFCPGARRMLTEHCRSSPARLLRNPLVKAEFSLSFSLS